MSHLELLLRRLAERPLGGYARTWAGTFPTGGKMSIVDVASTVGLDARGREGDFQTVSSEDAAIWLMLFATHSLLHGVRTPSGELLEEISECLSLLGPSATFFSKGCWQYTRRFKHYEPVQSNNEWARSKNKLFFGRDSDPLPPIDVLVDGGIIGIGSEMAFIYWVEEED